MKRAALLVGAVAVVSAGLGLAMVWVAFVPVPTMDLVEMLSAMVGAGGWSTMGLGPLLEPHNEHRLVLTRLAVLLDLTFFEAGQDLLLALILMSALATAALLAGFAYRLGARGWALAAFAGLAVGAVFNPMQHENLLSGFQVQFVQVWTFGLLAFFLLGLAPPGGDGRDRALRVLAVVLAMQAAALSTYSMKNGLLVWPLLVVLALWLGMSWRVVLAFLVAGGVVVWGEVSGFRPMRGHGDPFEALARPVEAARYLFRYLTSGVQAIGPVGQEVVGGLAVLFVLAAAVWSVIRRSGHRAVHGAMLAATGFLLASGAVTALGRLALGVEQANASRYATPSLVFLVLVVLLAVDRLAGGFRDGSARRPGRAVVLTAALAMLVLVPGTLSGVLGWQDRLADRDDKRQLAALYLADGPDPEALRKAFPHANAVPDRLFAFFKRKGVGPYRDVGSLLPFLPEFGSVVPEPDERCAGRLDQVLLNPVDRLRVAGWLTWSDPDRTDPSPTDEQPEMVLVTDAAGRLIGWGPNAGRAEPPLKRVVGSSAARRFVAVGPPPRPRPERLRVIGVSADRDRRCVLADAVAPPPRYVATLSAGFRPAKGDGWTPVAGRLKPLSGADRPLEPRSISLAVPDPAAGFRADWPVAAMSGPGDVAIPVRSIGLHPRAVTVAVSATDLGGVIRSESIGRAPGPDRWWWVMLRRVDFVESGSVVTVTLPHQPSGQGIEIGRPWLRSVADPE